MDMRAVRTMTLALVAALLGASCGGAHTPTASEGEAMAERIVLTAADLLPA